MIGKGVEKKDGELFMKKIIQDLSFAEIEWHMNNIFSAVSVFLASLIRFMLLKSKDIVLPVPAAPSSRSFPLRGRFIKSLCFLDSNGNHPSNSITPSMLLFISLSFVTCKGSISMDSPCSCFVGIQILSASALIFFMLITEVPLHVSNCPVPILTAQMHFIFLFSVYCLCGLKLKQ